jgi:hypothetical protein
MWTISSSSKSVILQSVDSASLFEVWTCAEIGNVCNFVISSVENGTNDLIGTALLPVRVTLR